MYELSNSDGVTISRHQKISCLLESIAKNFGEETRNPSGTEVITFDGAPLTYVQKCEIEKKKLATDYKKARNFGIGYYLAERWARTEARLRNEKNPPCWEACDLQENCKVCIFKIEKW